MPSFYNDVWLAQVFCHMLVVDEKIWKCKGVKVREGVLKAKLSVFFWRHSKHFVAIVFFRFWNKKCGQMCPGVATEAASCSWVLLCDHHVMVKWQVVLLWSFALHNCSKFTHRMQFCQIRWQENCWQWNVCLSPALQILERKRRKFHLNRHLFFKHRPVQFLLKASFPHWRDDCIDSAFSFCVWLG